MWCFSILSIRTFIFFLILQSKHWTWTWIFNTTLFNYNVYFMAVEPLMGHTQWYICQVTLNSTSFKPYYALACILAGGCSGEPFSPIIEGRAKNTDVSFPHLGDWQIWESKASYGETKNHSIQSQGLHPSDMFQGSVLSARGKDGMDTSHRSKNTRWLSHSVCQSPGPQVLLTL